MPAYKTVAIIGVGLIGGSIGKALRSRAIASEVVGVGRSQQSLAKALQAAAVDRVTTDLTDGVRNAEVVVVASPVTRVVQHLREAAEACPNAQLITDAGSTKGAICRDATAAFTGTPRFVGSHPLAGSHLSGVDAAEENLFLDRTVVVTPTESTPHGVADRAQGFWESLGALVVRMSPQEHDRALASTSHLPHFIASALAASTREQDLPLTASGWADTTRIAASDPALWADIFGQNRDALLQCLDGFQETVDRMRENLAAENRGQLMELLEHAKRIRNAVGD